MKIVKKIVAALVAAASIGAIGVTASASEEVLPLPADWMAVYQHGAPSSVNKTYHYLVEGRTRGYNVDCTYFNGGNGSTVDVTLESGFLFRFTRIGSYDGVVSGSKVPVLFGFYASGANVTANGKIKENIP